jgi:HEAT repeat protein
LLKEDESRWLAIEVLGRVGPEAKAAIPALTELLKDKDEGVRKAASEALDKIKETPGPTNLHSPSNERRSLKK